jgi:hypothetical protein
MARFESLKSATINTAASGETTFSGAPAPGVKLQDPRALVPLGRRRGLDGERRDVARRYRRRREGRHDPAAGQHGVSAAVQRPDFLFELSDNKALILSLSAAQLAQGGVTWSVVKTTGIVES